MKLTFLGTGAGLPSKTRNVSAIALDLLQEQGSIWLFDCGEATQHQILRTNIKPRKIEKIFITHLHGDHIYGLPGLLSSRSFQAGLTPVTLYGPKGIQAFIEISLQISQTNLTYPIEFVELEEEMTLDFNSFTVQVKQLDHGIHSFGFIINEKDQLGELQVEKLRGIGIEPGPIYQQIKQNPHTTLPNGQQIQRADFIGPNKPGRKLSILGDTRYLENLDRFIENSDLLVHEATFKGSDEELAYQYFHSTSVQAANLAKRAKVKQLVLTHISARYQGKELETIVNEARTIFQNTVIASDFSEIAISKD